MVVHEVNLNQAFDAALPNIQNYLTKNGYDPMEAPDVEIPLSHFVSSHFYSYFICCFAIYFDDFWTL